MEQDSNGIYITKSFTQLSYPDDGNNSCNDVEEKSFWFSHRNKIIQTVINRFQIRGNFADIGGGNGHQALFIEKNIFSDRRVFLIEPGYQGCVNAKKKGLKDIYNMTFDYFNFRDKNVTAVGLFDVIEHIENDAVFLKNLLNNVPDGTLLFITVPAYRWLWSETDEVNGHYRRYTRKMINKVVLNSGWNVQYSSYFFSLLPFLVFTLRCLPYKLGIRKGIKKIHESETQNHTGGFSEKVLEFLHKFEFSIIRKSSIPFGASIITVLKK